MLVHSESTTVLMQRGASLMINTSLKSKVDVRVNNTLALCTVFGRTRFSFTKPNLSELDACVDVDMSPW